MACRPSLSRGCHIFLLSIGGLTQGIHHADSTDPLFQWNIVFGSGERILARWKHPSNRYPEYPESVDRALFTSKPMALEGPGTYVNEFTVFIRLTGLESTVNLVGAHDFWFQISTTKLFHALEFQMNRPQG